MSQIIRPGFVYDLAIRSKADGRILHIEKATPNRVPLEGLNDMANSYLKENAAKSEYGQSQTSVAIGPMTTPQTLLSLLTDFS